MSEDERYMSVEQHLAAAEAAFPDPPRAGDVLQFYQQDLLKAQRQLLLAELKMAKQRVQ